MTRYKIILEYNGTTLIGWQSQNHGGVGLSQTDLCKGDFGTKSPHRSVQDFVEESIFRFCGQRVDVVSAGRTDAGVHALGMAASFELNDSPLGGESASALHEPVGGQNDATCPPTENPSDFRLPPKGGAITVMRAMNFYLGQMGAPIAVLSCESVADDFHARFSCKRRHYRYIILNRRAPVVLDNNMVWWIPRPLDIDAMRAAAQKLVGNHDWTSFRSSECQAKSPVKTLDEIKISLCPPTASPVAMLRLCGSPQGGSNSRERTTPPLGGVGEAKAEPVGGQYIIIDFSARSFLHHQVRNMVGTLVEIGLGKPYDIDEIFAAKNRAAAGPTAPAGGLYFVGAEY